MLLRTAENYTSPVSKSIKGSTQYVGFALLISQCHIAPSQMESCTQHTARGTCVFSHRSSNLILLCGPIAKPSANTLRSSETKSAKTCCFSPPCYFEPLRDFLFHYSLEKSSPGEFLLMVPGGNGIHVGTKAEVARILFP